MVALLHPQPISTGPAAGRVAGSGSGLRLVVDNERRAGAGRRSASVVDAGLRVVRPTPSGLAIDSLRGRASIGLIVAAALAVFGGLLMIRVAQGGPSADSWSGLEQSSVAGSAVGQASLVPSVGDAVVVAKAGDSMWSIAQQLAPESDPRPVVAALVEANGGDSVQIGQQIVIPRQLLD